MEKGTKTILGLSAIAVALYIILKPKGAKATTPVSILPDTTATTDYPQYNTQVIPYSVLPVNATPEIVPHAPMPISPDAFIYTETTETGDYVPEIVPHAPPMLSPDALVYGDCSCAVGTAVIDENGNCGCVNNNLGDSCMLDYEGECVPEEAQILFEEWQYIYLPKAQELNFNEAEYKRLDEISTRLFEFGYEIWDYQKGMGFQLTKAIYS